MAVDFNSATSAYNSVAKMFTPSSGGRDTASALGSPVLGRMEGPSFADMVKNGIQTTINAGREGEALSKLAIEGKADLRDVVMAVNNAEATLQTVLAVRDKVVNAYETILRMPI